MKKKNKHIDQIFSDQLKDQQINLSQDEMQAMFDQVKKPAIDELAKDMFDDFQMEVDEKMWQNVATHTTAKKQNKLAAIFSKFRIEPSPKDWEVLRKKLGALRLKEILNQFFRICFTAILILLSFWVNKNKSHQDLNSFEPKENLEQIMLNDIDNFINIDEDVSLANEKNVIISNPNTQNFKAPISDTLSGSKINHLSIIKLKPITDVSFSYVAPTPFIPEKTERNNKKIPIDCKFIPFPKKDHPFFIGVSYAFGNGSSNITSENQVFKDIRNSSDRNFVTQAVGLHVGYQSKRLQLSIGGAQENRNFESFYNHTVQIYDSIPVRDPNNQIIGYFYLNQRDSTYQTENRSQQTVVRIPLQLNYVLPVATRWSIILGGSFNFEHLKTNDNSMFINPNNGWLTSEKPSILTERQNFWSAGFNSGLNYRITSKFEFQSVLFMNRQINNKYETPDIKEIPYFWGVNLKLLYKL